MPYCAACIAHVTWARMGGWAGVALTVVVNSFFALLAAGGLHLLLSVAAEEPGSAPRFEVVLAGCLALGWAVAASKLRFRPGTLDRSHARGARDAVEIARFSEDVLVLRCHNDLFARELLQANPGAAETRAA